MVARQILPNQHGNGEMALRDSESGENPNGAPLSSEMLEGNRPAFPDEILKHVLDDQWYRERTPDRADPVGGELGWPRIASQGQY